jgi:hypothetical protein
MKWYVHNRNISIVIHTHYTVKYKILTFFCKIIEPPDRKWVQRILVHIMNMFFWSRYFSSAFGFEVSNNG